MENLFPGNMPTPKPVKTIDLIIELQNQVKELTVRLEALENKPSQPVASKKK